MIEEEVYENQEQIYERRDDDTIPKKETLPKEIEELITEKLMEGWTLLKRKCPSCNTSTLLQANDSVGMSNVVPYCIGCKAHVVTDKTMIDSVPSVMNDDSCYYNYDDNATKGKILVTFSMLDDIECTATHSGGGGVTATDNPCFAVLEEEDESSLLPNNEQRDGVCDEVIRDNVNEERDPSPIVSNTDSRVSNAEQEEPTISKSTQKKSEPPISQEVNEAKSSSTSSGIEVTRTHSNNVAGNKPNDMESTMTETSSFLALDYKSRREIATKELGSKLLEGYVLKNIPCDECGMPLMEKDKVIACVICPFLLKKAQQADAEQATLEKEVDVHEDDCTEDIITKSMLATQTKPSEPIETQPSQQSTTSCSIAEMLKKAEEAMKNAELKKVELSQRVEKMKLTSSYDDVNITDIYHDTSMRIHEDKADDAMLGCIDTDKIAELKYEEEKKKRNPNAIHDIVVTFSHDKKVETLTCLPSHDSENDDDELSSNDKYGRPGGLIPAICSSGSSNDNILPVSVKQTAVEEVGQVGSKEQAVVDENIANIMEKFSNDEIDVTTTTSLSKEAIQLKQSSQSLSIARSKSNSDSITNKSILENTDNNDDNQMIHVTSHCIEVEKSQSCNGDEDTAFLERLEQMALLKVKAADEAILKAKDAMDKLTKSKDQQGSGPSAILDILHQAEDKFNNQLMADSQQEEEQQLQFMTTIDIENESLEKRVCKIRDLLANRVLKGWTILPTYCKGELCGYSPLVRLNDEDIPTCVVCGGTGNGLDGLYLKIHSGGNGSKEEDGEVVPTVIDIADDTNDHGEVDRGDEQTTDNKSSMAPSASSSSEKNEDDTNDNADDDRKPAAVLSPAKSTDVEEFAEEIIKETIAMENEQTLHEEDNDITNNGYSIDDVVAAYGNNSLFVLSESQSSTLEQHNENEDDLCNNDTNVLSIDTSIKIDDDVIVHQQQTQNESVNECITEDLYETKTNTISTLANAGTGRLASPTDTEPLYALDDDEENNEEDIVDVEDNIDMGGTDVEVEPDVNQVTNVNEGTTATAIIDNINENNVRASSTVPEIDTCISNCSTRTSSSSLPSTDVEEELQRMRLLANEKVLEKLKEQDEMIAIEESNATATTNGPWDEPQQPQTELASTVSAPKQNDEASLVKNDSNNGTSDTLVNDDEVMEVNESSPEMVTKNGVEPDVRRECKDSEVEEVLRCVTGDNEDMQQPYEISEVPSDEIVLEKSASVASSTNDGNNNDDLARELSSSSHMSNVTNEDQIGVVISSASGERSLSVHDDVSTSDNQQGMPEVKVEDNTSNGDHVSLDEKVEESLKPQVEEEVVQAPSADNTDKDEANPMDEELDDHYKDYMNTLNVLRTTTSLAKNEIGNNNATTTNVIEPFSTDTSDVSSNTDEKTNTHTTIDVIDMLTDADDIITSEVNGIVVDETTVDREESITNVDVAITTSSSTHFSTNEVTEDNDLVAEESTTNIITATSPLTNESTNEVVIEDKDSVAEESTTNIITATSPSTNEGINEVITEDKDPSSSHMVTLQLPSDFNFDDENAVQYVLQQLRMTSSPAAIKSTKPSTSVDPLMNCNDDAKMVDDHVDKATTTEEVEYKETEVDDSAKTISPSSSGASEPIAELNDDINTCNSDDYEKYLPKSLQRISQYGTDSNENNSDNNGLNKLTSIIYEPVVPFLADTLSCTIGEMLHDGWTLLDQPPCKGCNAPLMKYIDNSAEDSNNNASGSTTDAIVGGQCVNVECPLSYASEDNNNSSNNDLDDDGGSTEVQSWDSDKDNACTSYDEDDSYFFEEDDPAIIQMQLNEMRKRGLIINNNDNMIGKEEDHQHNIIDNSNVVETNAPQDKSTADTDKKDCDTVDEIPSINENIIANEDPNIISDDNNNDSEEDAEDEDGNKEEEEEVKIKSYINMYDDDELDIVDNNNVISNPVTYAPPTPEARSYRNRSATITASTPSSQVNENNDDDNIVEIPTEEESKPDNEDVDEKRFSFDDEEYNDNVEEQYQEEEEVVTHIESFESNKEPIQENNIVEETTPTFELAETTLTKPRVKYEGPPRPEDDDYDDDDDDLYYEPSPPQPQPTRKQHHSNIYNQNIHRNTTSNNIMSTLKRTPSSDANNDEIMRKDSFTNLIINTSASYNDSKHPTDVSLLTTATSFQQEQPAAVAPAPVASSNMGQMMNTTSNNNKHLPSTYNKISSDTRKPNFEQFLQTSTFSSSNNNKKTSKSNNTSSGVGSGNNGPPRPDLYDIDESVADDTAITTNMDGHFNTTRCNSMGLPLVIESGITNHYDNESLLSYEESLKTTSTFGSESLANILCKIEHVKDELSTPLLSMAVAADGRERGNNNDDANADNISYGSSKFKSEISNQMEMAQLIERLASAAIAVKQMEKSKKSSS